MITVGLRELRQDASKLVEAVQAGEEVLITVSGRPAARLVPADAKRPATAEETRAVLALFRDPRVGDWAADMAELDDDVDLSDPWERKPRG